jgi:hypothetical protein
MWLLKEITDKPNTYRIVDVCNTEAEAWEAADRMCAVINVDRNTKDLASGYKIEEAE